MLNNLFNHIKENRGLIPAVALIFIIGLVAFTRVNSYLMYASLADDEDEVRGFILSHPYRSGRDQVFKVKDKFIRTSWFPEHSIGDYVVVIGSGYPDIRVIDEKSIKTLRILSKFRSVLVSHIKEDFQEPYSSLILGMTLGYKPNFPDQLDSLLKDTGTIHIIVVSGYNVSILLSVVSIFLSRFGRRVFVGASVFFIVAYLLIVGLDPPVVRASIMGLVAVWAMALGEYRYSTYLLFLVALFMVTINPSFLFNISFQMSFAATYAVIISSEIGQGRGRLVQMILTLGCVNVVLFPIISFYFARVSLIGPAVNLLVLWIVPFVTFGGFLYMILPNILLETFIVSLIDYFIVVSESLVKLLPSLEYKISIEWIFVYYILCFLIYRLMISDSSSDSNGNL